MAKKPKLKKPKIILRFVPFPSEARRRQAYDAAADAMADAVRKKRAMTKGGESR